MKYYCLPAALLVIFTTSLLCAADFPLWGKLKRGQYEPGFEVRLQYDYSRTFRSKYDLDGKFVPEPRMRPVQTLIWYPAKAQRDARRMIYHEYVELIAQELNFETPSASARKVAVENYISNRTNVFRATEDGVKKLLVMQTAAIKNAERAAGKFPLIIYAPGAGGFAFENSVFCEYLASHGYIVAAMPSMGAYSRSATVDLTGFYAYMQDIEFVIGSTHGYPNLDGDRLALTGFSMGGSAATLVQMRNTDIDAVVYFDTGVVFEIVDDWFRPSNYYERANLRAPQLYLTRGDAPGLDTKFLDSLPYADVYSIMTSAGYRHPDFMSEGRFASTIPGYLSIETRTDGGLLFDVVCEYTHRFLDAYVKRDAASLQSLAKKPEENGVPQNLMTIEFKQAIKAPPREWEIAEIIRRSQSVSEVRELVSKAKTQNWKSPVIGEGLLNTLGYEFLFRGNTNLAIDTFQLAAEMYPSSANVYDSLSEAFDRAGKKDKAVELAEKALQLLESDPGITDQRREIIRTSASNRLKRLNNK